MPQKAHPPSRHTVEPESPEDTCIHCPGPGGHMAELGMGGPEARSGGYGPLTFVLGTSVIPGTFPSDQTLTQRETGLRLPVPRILPQVSVKKHHFLNAFMVHEKQRNRGLLLQVQALTLWVTSGNGR